MSLEAAEARRRMSQMILIGTVAEVDCAKAVARVRVGQLLSGWRPFPCLIGTNGVSWVPLRVGAQVVLVCPSGDLAQALIVGQLYSSAVGAPSAAPEVESYVFKDGSKVEYNSSTKQLTIKAASSVLIDAPAVRITGDLQVDGGIHSNGDTVAGSVSLQQHKHSGVASGGSTTGTPV